MRLCGPCLADILTTLGTHWTKVDIEDTTPLATVCGACQAELDGQEDRNAFFGTVFEHPRERVDYFARYCGDCASDLILELKLQQAF